MPGPISPKKQRLEDAFQVFNHVSEQLVDSYQQLQSQVVGLSHELAEARSERMLQLVEKERLANRLARLLETLPAAVVVVDGDGKVEQFNPAASRLFPLLAKEDNWPELYLLNFRAGRINGEQWLNSGRLVKLTERALDPEPGKIVLLLDITESHELQERIDRQQRLSTLGEMAAQLAHQIRTPLSSAILYTSHLSRDDLTEDQRRRFSSRCSDRLLHIERQINDMLVFTRGGQFEPEAIDMAALLTELAQHLEPMLRKFNAHFELIGVELVDAWISGNQDAMLGALMNLAVNALEQGGAGVRLQIGLQRNDSDVTLQVHDDGPGIPLEQQSKIFDPFYTTRSDGTGLGLAVVQSVVLGHEGEISLESRPGKGASFTLSFPLMKEHPTELNNKRSIVGGTERRLNEVRSIA
ncbi:MAG: ATP-binding protein [Candidatus Sedimenticola sp. (ex Thyasira tokunagai)]